MVKNNEAIDSTRQMANGIYSVVVKGTSMKTIAKKYGVQIGSGTKHFIFMDEASYDAFIAEACK